jgi:hypothetical protein
MVCITLTVQNSALVLAAPFALPLRCSGSFIGLKQLPGCCAFESEDSSQASKRPAGF